MNYVTLTDGFVEKRRIRMDELWKWYELFGQDEEPKQPNWWEFPAEEYPEELTEEQRNEMTALMWDDMFFDADHDFDGDGFEGFWED
jgi:hypothetical protein